MRRLFHHPFCWPLVVVWAAPWTLLGIALGIAAICTGGGAQRVGRVVEFYGGVLNWLLSRVPIVGGASALTLGHAVIARTAADLERSRMHEFIHVRQYERWGLLFVPAYFIAAAIAWWRGGHAYLDNVFEQEAYGTLPPRTRADRWLHLALFAAALAATSLIVASVVWLMRTIC